MKQDDYNYIAQGLYTARQKLLEGLTVAAFIEIETLLEDMRTIKVT